MAVPPWLLFFFATLVGIWGAYRIKLGLRSKEAEERAMQRRGLFGLPRRTHLLIGAVYVLLAAGLVAVGLGWQPVDFSAKPAPTSPK
jgi:hypothetical protein